jgi:hypothetical protein
MPMPQSAIDKTFAPRPKYEQKHDRNYADKKDGVLGENGRSRGGQYKIQYLNFESDRCVHAPRTQKRYGKSGTSRSTHTSRPHLENVAALNSGRANSLPQICGDLLHSFARISVFAAGNRRDVEAYYCGKN